MLRTVRSRLLVLLVALVLGLGAGLLVRQARLAEDELELSEQQQAALADTVTLLVASTYGGSVPTTAELSAGVRTVGGIDSLGDDAVLSADALAEITADAAQIARETSAGPGTLSAHASPHTITFDADGDGRVRVDAGTLVETPYDGGVEGATVVESVMVVDAATGEIFTFKTLGLEDYHTS